MQEAKKAQVDSGPIPHSQDLECEILSSRNSSPRKELYRNVLQCPFVNIFSITSPVVLLPLQPPAPEPPAPPSTPERSP